MAKIPKNRSDSEMMAGYKEKTTFENAVFSESELQAKPIKKEAKADFASSFLTPELQEKVGKALLELKVDLFKEGIVDYNIKVSRDGKQVILTAVPAKPKTK